MPGTRGTYQGNGTTFTFGRSSTHIQCVCALNAAFVTSRRRPCYVVPSSAIHTSSHQQPPLLHERTDGNSCACCAWIDSCPGGWGKGEGKTELWPFSLLLLSYIHSRPSTRSNDARHATPLEVPSSVVFVVWSYTHPLHILTLLLEMSRIIRANFLLNGLCSCGRKRRTTNKQYVAGSWV